MEFFGKFFDFFHFFHFFMFTQPGQALYTRDLVNVIKMGNPYNFLVDSAFVVV